MLFIIELNQKTFSLGANSNSNLLFTAFIFVIPLHAIEINPLPSLGGSSSFRRVKPKAPALI